MQKTHKGGIDPRDKNVGRMMLIPLPSEEFLNLSNLKKYVDFNSQNPLTSMLTGEFWELENPHISKVLNLRVKFNSALKQKKFF